MKRIALSFLLVMVPLCCANTIADIDIDKDVLRIIQCEVLEERKKGQQEFHEMTDPFNEAHLMPLRIMNDLIADDDVQLYLKNMSDYIFDLMINEERSLRYAINEAIQKEAGQKAKAYKKFEELSYPYLQSGDLLYEHIYLLVVYLDFTFGEIILDNLLQKIEWIGNKLSF